MRELSRHFTRTFAVSQLFARCDSSMKLDLTAGGEQIIDHFPVKNIMKVEACRNCAVGPGDRALLADELLVSREARAARLYLILRTPERSSDSRR